MSRQAGSQLHATPPLRLAEERRWVDGGIRSWRVVEYPDLQAAQKVTELHEQNPLFRYADSEFPQRAP